MTSPLVVCVPSLVLAPVTALCVANMLFHWEAHHWGIADIGRRLGLGAAILLVMITVAMLGVTSFLLASLVARRRMFGLLHALGVSAAQMRRTLVLEAALIGMVGTILGLLGGALAGWALVDGAVPALYGWRFELVLPLASAAQVRSWPRTPARASKTTTPKTRRPAGLACRRQAASGRTLPSLMPSG